MPDESMYEFETDLKKNGSASRFYKYVQERNIEKYRANLKGRMKLHKNVTSGAMSVDGRTIRNATVEESTITPQATSSSRAISEMNITAAEGCHTPKTVVVLTNETTQRRLYQSNREDTSDRRWSSASKNACEDKERKNKDDQSLI